ncbi:MAG: response regulator [Spirochaetales bacterium]|nr:response regulator [Spirochaetales bacterium]
MKILIAEDEYTTRKLMEIKLDRAGIQYDFTSDGKEALEMFSRGGYSVVVLDQYMPGMNGNMIARHIREKNDQVPIIGITSDETQREQMLEDGFTDVFIKPLRNQDYITTLKKFLE